MTAAARVGSAWLAATVLVSCGGGSPAKGRSLDEPLTAALSAAETVATGRVYGIDREGQGTVVLYRLADGGHVLRFEDFSVSAVGRPGEVRLSAAAAPRTTADVAGAASATIGTLRAAAGSMNYPVPASVDVGAYRSVVVWDGVRKTASVAATLKPAS